MLYQLSYAHHIQKRGRRELPGNNSTLLASPGTSGVLWHSLEVDRPSVAQLHFAKTVFQMPPVGRVLVCLPWSGNVVNTSC